MFHFPLSIRRINNYNFFKFKMQIQFADSWEENSEYFSSGSCLILSATYRTLSIIAIIFYIIFHSSWLMTVFVAGDAMQVVCCWFIVDESQYSFLQMSKRDKWKRRFFVKRCRKMTQLKKNSNQKKNDWKQKAKHILLHTVEVNQFIGLAVLQFAENCIAFVCSSSDKKYIIMKFHSC